MQRMRILLISWWVGRVFKISSQLQPYFLGAFVSYMQPEEAVKFLLMQVSQDTNDSCNELQPLLNLGPQSCEWFSYCLKILREFKKRFLKKAINPWCWMSRVLWFQFFSNQFSQSIYIIEWTDSIPCNLFLIFDSLSTTSFYTFLHDKCTHPINYKALCQTLRIFLSTYLPYRLLLKSQLWKLFSWHCFLRKFWFLSSEH